MLLVSELMTVKPITISPDACLRQAIVLMNEESHRQLPVVKDGRLVGIITNRDVRLALDSPLINKDTADRMRLVEDHIVEECMTADPMTVNPTTPIYKVAEMLILYKVGAFPVMDGDKLVGIISVSDLLRHLAMQARMANI